MSYHSDRHLRTVCLAERIAYRLGIDASSSHATAAETERCLAWTARELELAGTLSRLHARLDGAA